MGTVDGVTSETNGPSSPDPSNSSDEPDIAPSGSAPPTTPMPVQTTAEGSEHQTTQGLPLLPAPPPSPEPPSASQPAETASVGERETQGLPRLPASPLPSPPAAPEPAAQRPHSHRRTGHAVYHTSAVYGGGARQQQQPPPVKRRTVAVMVTSGVLAALVVALVLVLTVFKPGSGAPTYGIIPNGASAQQDGQQVAAAFLTAWQEGDLTKAANYTDKHAAAAAALAAY